MRISRSSAPALRRLSRTDGFLSGDVRVRHRMDQAPESVAPRRIQRSPAGRPWHDEGAPARTLPCARGSALPSRSRRRPCYARGTLSRSVSLGGGAASQLADAVVHRGFPTGEDGGDGRRRRQDVDRPCGELPKV